jgi:phage tail tape-measure protein
MLIRKTDLGKNSGKQRVVLLADGGGAAAGAAGGAAIGSVVPVVGTAAGAIVGGVIGGVAGSEFGDDIEQGAEKAGKAIADGAKNVWNKFLANNLDIGHC